MKCVMLFPKYNVRNKISSCTNFSYRTWYYNCTVAATNKKAYFGEYLPSFYLGLFGCSEVVVLVFCSFEHKQV